MKRKKQDPGIPPWVDQFGRGVYDNPFGRYRRNPALDVPATPAEGPAAPIVQVRGWEERERHFTSGQPIEPGQPPSLPPAGEPTAPPERRPAPQPSPERVAELARLLDEAAAAATEPAATATPKPAAEADADAPALTRAERLAKQAAERRTRSRLRIRRGGSIAAAGGVVFSLTAIYGFWTGGADAGDRVKNVLPVAAEATAGLTSSPLTPGSRADVNVRVVNPNPFAVTITSVSGGPFPSSVNGAPGCTIANSGVTFIPPRFVNVSIPAKSLRVVRLVDAAQMGKGAAPECRGHTFTIPVSVSVASHKG